MKKIVLLFVIGILSTTLISCFDNSDEDIYYTKIEIFDEYIDSIGLSLISASSIIEGNTIDTSSDEEVSLEIEDNLDGLTTYVEMFNKMTSGQSSYESELEYFDYEDYDAEALFSVDNIDGTISDYQLRYNETSTSISYDNFKQVIVFSIDGTLVSGDVSHDIKANITSNDKKITMSLRVLKDALNYIKIDSDNDEYNFAIYKSDKLDTEFTITENTFAEDYEIEFTKGVIDGNYNLIRTNDSLELKYELSNIKGEMLITEKDDTYEFDLKEGTKEKTIIKNK